MKHALLAMTLLLSVGASADALCAKAEQHNYVQTIERWWVGEVTRTDINMAQGAWLSAALKCGIIEKRQYCYEATVSADSVLEGVKEEVKVGQRDTADLIAAQAEVTRIKDLCESVH